MSERVNIQDISAGYRPIVEGRKYNRFFDEPESTDRIILDNGDVDDTVKLMKRWYGSILMIPKELQASCIQEVLCKPVIIFGISCIIIFSTGSIKKG